MKTRVIYGIVLFKEGLEMSRLRNFFVGAGMIIIVIMLLITCIIAVNVVIPALEYHTASKEQYTTYSELLLAAEKSPDIDTAEIYLKAAITYIQENGLLNGYDLEIKEGTFPLYQKGSNNINAWWKELNDDLADIQLARENLATGNDSGILPSDVMKNLITPAYINPPRL